MQEQWSLDVRAPERTGNPDVALDALAARAAEGDRAAFEQIYLQLAGELYTYVHGQCHEAATAEDIVANVFLRAWRSARAYRVGSMQFRRWIFTIARNEVRDHWRSSQRTVPMFDMDFCDEHTTDQPPDPAHAQVAVRQALGVLTEEQRQVVVLRYFNNKTHKEIAQVLGKREGAVRALLLRAMRHMRKVMIDASP